MTYIRKLLFILVVVSQLASAAGLESAGIPGNTSGYTYERVLRAPCAGIFHSELNIGETVKKGQIVGYVDNTPVKVQIDGVLRGQIRNNTMVANKLKIGDIDPRGNIEYCAIISEKHFR